MSASKPVIEPVKASDLEDIAAMMHDDMIAFGRSSNLEDMRTLCQMAFEDAKATHGVIFLAARTEHSGRPIGTLLAHQRLSLRFGGPSLWVEELYVKPDVRMGGVGRALVLYVLGLARARGLRGVDLEAYRMNTGASILYRSIGFERLARERYALDLDDLDWEA